MIHGYDENLLRAENHYWQGLILLDQNRYSDAERYFASAIALDPLHSESHYWRGVLSLRKGRCDLAAADLTDSISIEPTVAEGYLQLAVAQRELHSMDNAFNNFTRFVSCLASLKNDDESTS